MLYSHSMNEPLECVVLHSYHYPLLVTLSSLIEIVALAVSFLRQVLSTAPVNKHCSILRLVPKTN